MQFGSTILFSALLVTVAAQSAYQNTVKLRRDGVLNLYPFPRVGRAAQGWEIPLENVFLEYRPMRLKRQHLVPFPRVGRSEVADPRKMPYPTRPLELSRETAGGFLERFAKPSDRMFQKRESVMTDTTGMWFGPRLGRSDKEFSDDDMVTQRQAIKGEVELDADNEVRKKRSN